MRNTIKAKEPSSEAPVKLKKTSSHLNELLMKNKEKIKPLIALKSFSGFGKRWSNFIYMTIFVRCDYFKFREYKGHIKALKKYYLNILLAKSSSLCNGISL